ncbi:hypothetical protein XENTR_v10009368 [Xenopus tropicalis]|nr:hypothetical protein XENTR_v10009368 [Xenopus tropicalis]
MGEKESGDTPLGLPVTYKAGWLKKSSGLLGLWKDRHIVLLKTQLLLCESENDQKGEAVELADYERCQDHKGFLKRKRHFTLIPSPQTKGQDLKFQARNVEERDAWIQALNEGISRGKNKIFDEVKVDTSCSLDHVTRDRAQKGAAKRRPPTRIHLKGVAEAAEDGSSILDLEKLEGVVHKPAVSMSEDTKASPEKGPVKIPTPQTEPVLAPEKKPVKIPVPPPKQGPMPEKEHTKIPTLPLDKTSVQPSIGKPHPDNTDSVAPIIRPPSPPPKILKENIYAREKLLSNGGNTNPEVNLPVSGSRENLVDINNPPQPPPKILSDKMKIKWEGSTSDLMDKDSIKPVDRGSKENLVEFDSNELEKTSVESAELSDEAKEPELNDDMNSQQSNDQDIFDQLDEKTTEEVEEGSDNSETKEMPDPSEVQKKETAKEEAFEDSGCIQSMEEQSSQVQSTLTQINPALAKSTIPERIPRSSSLGDFLSEDSMGSESRSGHKTPMLHLTKDHLQQVEMKLARGREKTETLLNRVLQGDLINSPEGNGPEAETLLNEAVKQLKEASEVLQELQESSNVSIDVAGAVTLKKRDLVTLYRRSVP